MPSKDAKSRETANGRGNADETGTTLTDPKSLAMAI
jgi:hypothetical protein